MQILLIRSLERYDCTIGFRETRAILFTRIAQTLSECRDKPIRATLDLLKGDDFLTPGGPSQSHH